MMVIHKNHYCICQNLWFHTEVNVLFTVINHYMMKHIGLKRRVGLDVENVSVIKSTGFT